jgi:diguanylate cyclase (GGDEF)-like protein
MSKVLIVDDNLDTLFTLKQVIQGQTDCEIVTADSGQDCLAMAGVEDPDVILLDIQMPDMDGFTTCELLKADERTKHIPVIFLTAAYKDVGSKVLGLQIGADDYLTKPIDNRELMARLSVALRMRQSEDELRAQMVKLQEQATTDITTGIANRRCFEERLAAECQDAERHERTLSLLMIDIDHFKTVNDGYGHQMGDHVLKEIANVLRESVRGTDTVARYGGEEFAVILREPQKDGEDGAAAAAERIRRTIANTPLVTIGRNESLYVTVSIGIASYPEDAVFPAPLLEAADQALYYAKRSGRNQVASASSPWAYIAQLEQQCITQDLPEL